MTSALLMQNVLNLMYLANIRNTQDFTHSYNIRFFSIPPFHNKRLGVFILHSRNLGRVGKTLTRKDVKLLEDVIDGHLHLELNDPHSHAGPGSHAKAHDLSLRPLRLVLGAEPVWVEGLGVRKIFWIKVNS